MLKRALTAVALAAASLIPTAAHADVFPGPVPCGTHIDSIGRVTVDVQDWPAYLRPLALSSSSSVRYATAYDYTASGALAAIYKDRYEVRTGAAGNGLPVRITNWFRRDPQDNAHWILLQETDEWWTPVCGSTAWKHHSEKAGLEQARWEGFPA